MVFVAVVRFRGDLFFAAEKLLLVTGPFILVPSNKLRPMAACVSRWATKSYDLIRVETIAAFLQLGERAATITIRRCPSFPSSLRILVGLQSTSAHA
jgi:hypothetical protein